MRPESHLSVAAAQVREHELACHGVLELDGRRTFAIAGALGPPRLWGMVVRATLEGFREGLEASQGEGARRLLAGVEGASARLARLCDALIERMLPDATLVALLVDHAELHVVSVGPGRVYLHRRGRPQRLTPRDDPPGALLRGTPVRCSVPIEPNDIVLAGSVSAFSARAIGTLASVLEADPHAAPPVLATLLTEPAARAGVGAAAVALRVR